MAIVKLLFSKVAGKKCNYDFSSLNMIKDKEGLHGKNE
jgi:hypothetical protein